MIVLLGMLGCAQHLFGERNIDCEGFTQLEVVGQDDLSVTFVGGDSCDIRTNADARRYDDDGVLFIEQVRSITIQGNYDRVSLNWGDNLFVDAGEVFVESAEPGELRISEERGLECNGCNLDILAGAELGMTLEGDAQVRVCSGSSGFAGLQRGSFLDLALAPSGEPWAVVGEGVVEAHLPLPNYPVTVDDGVQYTPFIFDDAVRDCCAELGFDECGFGEADADVDADADSDVDADADTDADTDADPVLSTCMACHNGDVQYNGGGLENPHPSFHVECQTCHGGDPTAPTAGGAHVPRPPSLLGPGEQPLSQLRTLEGVDRLPGYSSGGTSYQALDWLQFRNPGDLRVVSQNRSCGLGGCHADYAGRVARSPMGTNVALYSTPEFFTLDPANTNNSWGTDGVFAFRDVFGGAVGLPGSVASLAMLDTSVTSTVWGIDDVVVSISDTTNQAIPGGFAHELLQKAVDGGCGSCHLGSAGKNDGPGLFRSSGCTACHMPAAVDGRIQSNDGNLDTFEPINPGAPGPAERIHVGKHEIVSTAFGATGAGVPDSTCATCHVGSSGISLEYKGIRLDARADVANGTQYPENPDEYWTLDPLPGGYDTWLGYSAEQLLTREDYDSDGRNDIPPDVHYEAGMWCIDCHIAPELHGPGEIVSHSEQASTIRCETCHGTTTAGPTLVPCLAIDGVPSDCAVDERGNPLDHVFDNGSGQMLLLSKGTGGLLYIPQTQHVVTDFGVFDPVSAEPLFRPNAQLSMTPEHDSLECIACHSSWMNTCVSCHVTLTQGQGQVRSSVRGDPLPIQIAQQPGQSTPLYFSLGVGPRGKIQPFQPATPTFFEIDDGAGGVGTFAFSDRNGNGNHPSGGGRSGTPALNHAAATPHTIRGRPTANEEGVRYCVACHLTEANAGIYQESLNNLNNGNLDFVPYPGNPFDDPLAVRMAAGLGVRLYRFAYDGCAINDQGVAHPGCDNNPADPDASVFFEIDRAVELSGVSNASSTHPMQNGPSFLRSGANDVELSGPLGVGPIDVMTNPNGTAVLNGWLDGDGNPFGTLVEDPNP